MIIYKIIFGHQKSLKNMLKPVFQYTIAICICVVKSRILKGYCVVEKHVLKGVSKIYDVQSYSLICLNT